MMDTRKAAHTQTEGEGRAMSCDGMSRGMGAFSAESSADSESWHQTLVEEVARRAERHAEELETRFRERMEMSLSFELAKIDAASKRHAGSLPPGPGQRRGKALGASAADDLNAEESFKRLHHLRRRYRQLQGPEKAHLSSDELRARLSRFYECMCPSKLNNVPRIVSSFEARGGTSQALWDLNCELLGAYGHDLESIAPRQIEGLAYPLPPASLHHYPAHNPSQVILSHSAVRSVAHVHNATPPVATGRTAHTLQDRLAMLSDEALVEARQASQRLSSDRIDTEGHATMPNPVTRSNPASTPRPSGMLHDDSRSNSLTYSPQQRRAQNSHQVAHHMPASAGAGGNDTNPSSDFVGTPSPRWAGNCLGQARAKYQYTARHADELSFSAGDVVQITGKSADGWLWGYCNGFKGLLPANFVAMIQADQDVSGANGPPSIPAADNLVHTAPGLHLHQQLQASQSSLHRPYVYCPTGHIMQVDSDGTQGWCCDVCHILQSSGARRLRCKECDYNVCDECNPQKRALHPAAPLRLLYASGQR